MIASNQANRLGKLKEKRIALIDLFSDKEKGGNPTCKYRIRSLGIGERSSGKSWVREEIKTEVDLQGIGDR
jgi:hypothetical protein